MYRLIILFSIGTRVLQYHGVHGRTKFSTRVLNFLTSFFNPHTIFKIFHIQTLCKSAQEVLKYYSAVSVLQEYRHHKPSITVSLRNSTSQLISNFVNLKGLFQTNICLARIPNLVSDLPGVQVLGRCWVPVLLTVLFLSAVTGEPHSMARVGDFLGLFNSEF